MSDTFIVVGDGDTTPPQPPAIDTEQLKKAIASVKKKHGQGIIMTAAEMLKPKGAIPTGSLALDRTLRVGGFPRGRITEIFSPESTGKTTLAQCAVAQCQKQGGVACYLDIERATMLDYMEACGVDTDSLLLAAPADGTQAMTLIAALLDQVDLIVVDSVAAMMSEQEARSDPGDVHVGELPRLLSQELKRMLQALASSKTALVFLNQIREKIGIRYGNPETTPGGRALKFYASIRIRLSRASRPDKNGHYTVKATIKKSKVGPPLEVAEFEITPTGINEFLDIATVAKDAGVITSSGGYYRYGDETIAHGLSAAADWLRDNPEKAAEIRKRVLSGEPGRAPRKETERPVEVQAADAEGIF